MKKTFRAGMAFLLVLALLLYLSPVRVSASALPEAAAVVTKVIPFAKVVEPAALGVGGSVFCWVAAGLGLVFTATQAVDAYNAYQDFTGDLETSIYYYPDGSWSYGVDIGFIDRVRAFFFDAGYLVDTGNLSTIVPEGETFRDYTADAPCVAFMYSYSYYVSAQTKYYFSKQGYLVCTVPDYNFSVNGVKATSSITFGGNKYYIYNIYSGADSLRLAELNDILAQPSDFYYVGDCGTTYTLQRVLKNYGWSGVQGSGDTVIDYVAPPDVSVDVSYPDWYTNARPAIRPDTGEDITVLPIPLNPSADPETQIGTLTQPDIWQGSIADPMPEPEPLPDTNIADTPWSDVQDWLTPSGQPGQFGIQLRDYFPFCIPFDLYDFLTVLAADPEAPCFVWEVPVPQMGRTFTVEVDLSPWDSVAALFRKLELLAFIVGLGWVTREKIRG